MGGRAPQPTTMAGSGSSECGVWGHALPGHAARAHAHFCTHAPTHHGPRPPTPTHKHHRNGKGKIAKDSPFQDYYYKCSNASCTAKKTVKRDNVLNLVTSTHYKV
jgi:hypothetical protein